MSDYATLLRDHVTLTCRSVDRIFLQAYVPKLQSVGGVCQFLCWQKGFGIPSSAAFGKIGDGYVAEVYRWAKKNAIPVRRFAKGENKEQIARPLIEAAERDGGDGRVVLIGIAQEKTPMWRSWKAKGQEHAAHPHMEWGRQMGFVNHFISTCGIPTGAARFGRPTPTPLAGVDLAQRAQLGAAAMRSARHRLHRPGQRVPQLRGPRGAAADLRPARLGRGEELVLALAEAAALPANPRGSACGLRLRAGVSPVRDLRYPGV